VVLPALVIACTAGCGAISFLIGYAIFGGIPAGTISSCSEPGVCGASGAILALYKDPEGEHQVVVELLDPEAGTTGRFVDSASTSLNGMSFAKPTEDEVVLHVAADDGVRVYDGVEFNRLLRTIAVGECGRVADVLPLGDGDILVACPDQGRIVRMHPGDGRRAPDFSCCEGVPDGDLLRTIAVDPAGRIYSGTHAVYVFELTSGAFLQVLLSAEDAGAVSFEDVLWGPEGVLYVAAPELGVLMVDPESGAVLGVLRPGEIDFTWSPSALAFDLDGFLLVGSSRRGSIVRLDSHSGELIDVLDAIPALDVASLTVRP
jgi:hypothetical protein